jgi:hypothetical protein
MRVKSLVWVLIAVLLVVVVALHASHRGGRTFAHVMRTIHGH